MVDNEIIELYFNARGWESPLGDTYWVSNTGKKYHLLPPILTDFPAFKEHVLEPMEKEGFNLEVIDGKWVRWLNPKKLSFENDAQEIKDANILHAAVIAATSFEKSGNGRWMAVFNSMDFKPIDSRESRQINFCKEKKEKP